MFDDFFSLSPTVSENGSYYIIGGINFKDFQGDLKSTYGTSIIATRILTRMSTSRFSVHKFFTVELAWILDDLVNKQSGSKARYYRVGINKYRALYNEVKNKTWIKSTFEEYEPYDLKSALKGFTIKPFADQEAFLENYRNIKLGFQLKGVLLDAAPGAGKANWVGSNILTPHGYVKMRNIKVGDYVIGRSGQPTRVNAVYPQGKKQLYRITFKDGRSDLVCEEHLWSIRYAGLNTTVETKELIKLFNIPNESRDAVFIPLMEDCYDGSVSTSELPLECYDAGVKCRDEAVDGRYLHTSREARYELLCGFMDVMGGLREYAYNRFESYSLELAKQVQYLVRSLGGVASIFTGYECNYVVEFNIKQSFIEMVSIEPDIIDDAQCISVDAEDSLYICNDFIVTHNTPTSLMWTRMVSKGKTVILVPKHLIQDPWVDHLDPKGERYCFSKPPKYWLSTSDKDPIKSDAEFFIFYTEQVRKDNWNGIPFTKIINALSKNGSEPIKMIIDESHNYNDYSSQQTQGMVEFASNSKISDVLFMSGTPLKAQGRETYPMFIVLDKYFDEQVRDDFKKMYSRDNYFLNEMLAHRLGRIKFTIKAIEGMSEPPVPETIAISFPGVEQYTLKNIRAEMIYYIQERAVFYQKNMANYIHDWKGYLNAYEETIEENPALLSELARYRNTVNHFINNGYNNFTDSDKSKFCKEVEKRIEEGLKGDNLKYFRHITPAIKYLGLKIRGEALGNVLGKARINAIVDMVTNTDLAAIVKSGIKKTAIYSTYIEAINESTKKLKEDGCHPLTLHSQSTMDVNEVLRKLRTPEYDSIVTSFDTLSEGSPLLMCNQLLLLNAPWREYILRQTIARIWRKGQDTQCFVWLLDLDTGDEDNITTRTIDIMSYYKDIVDQLLNGGLGFDTVEGVSLRFTDNETFDFSSLIPFDIPTFNFRPKFKEKSFTDMFR